MWSAQCQGLRRRQHRAEHRQVQKLKFLTPPGIEPGPPGWKAGTLPTMPRISLLLLLLLLSLLLLLYVEYFARRQVLP